MASTCEISGESLATTKEEVVVTPSGHTCIKRLLLAKLSENGGMDPFETMRQLPLSEDQLITLQRTSNQVAPPRPQATSLPNLLQLMQSEYDALVLELFDTRKALEDTRRELSQALYQNDAAVRVIARLSMERDTARQDLEKWNASVGANGSSAGPTPDTEEADEPQAKRRRVETVEPLKNSIPEEDLQVLVDTWGTLQPQRKPKLKAAAASAPSPEDLANYTSVEKKSWHKSSCKGLTCMAKSGDLIVTAGKDKQIVVYSVTEKVVKNSFSFGRTIPTCVDIHQNLVVVGNGKGSVAVYSLQEESVVGEFQAASAVVDVRVHPTGKHICVATADGKVSICLLDGSTLHHIAEFESSEESTEYSCGALHPDGLIYAAGTKDGQIHMWDLKNKLLASTLQEGDENDAVVSIAFSNNGYHLATSHASATVRFWDLRKQKTIAILNQEYNLKSVTSLAYDDSGKYFAYGGNGGVEITTVKEWKTTATLAGGVISGIVWGDSMVVTCSEKGRDAEFHGKAA